MEGNVRQEVLAIQAEQRQLERRGRELRDLLGSATHRAMVRQLEYEALIEVCRAFLDECRQNRGLGLSIAHHNLSMALATCPWGKGEELRLTIGLNQAEMDEFERGADLYLAQRALAECRVLAEERGQYTSVHATQLHSLVPRKFSLEEVGVGSVEELESYLPGRAYFGKLSL